MKAERQSKIIELIERQDVETQEELAELLTREGYDVTQATVSRDIRELKLMKVMAEGGKQKYAVFKSQESEMTEKYARVLKDGFLFADIAQNIVVIKTVAGMAMAVAAAVDAMHIDGIVGCIAGDDTILCAVRTVKEAHRVMEKIVKISDSKYKTET